MKYKFILIWLVLILAACGGSPALPATPTGPRTLTVMTHDSFAVSETVIQAFEQQNNTSVEILAAGDAGSALNKAILTKDNPLADVFYGLDNTFLSRALDEGLFEAYTPAALADVPQAFRLDPQDRAIPIDYGDVCLNYDKAYFTAQGIAPPQTLEDLLKPEYEGLLVVQNPATSSTGLAFLLATIGHFGQKGYIDYWKGLRANDLLVVNDWEKAYNETFTLRGGPRPIVVSYASSPPFEVLYAETPMSEPPTGVVVGDGACFRQIEFVGILKNAKNRDLAEKWVDFMLSLPFQEDIPLQMYVFPVNPQARLDETFVKFLATPANPAAVDPADIATRREQWITAWTEAVLR